MALREELAAVTIDASPVTYCTIEANGADTSLLEKTGCEIVNECDTVDNELIRGIVTNCSSVVDTEMVKNANKNLKDLEKRNKSEKIEKENKNFITPFEMFVAEVVPDFSSQLDEEVPFETQVKSLGLPASEPISFSEVELSDDLDNEVSYGGEGPDLPEVQEKKAILQIIDEKLNKVDEGFTVEQLRSFREVLVKNWQAFGVDQGTGQMSLLSPIHCILKDDAPQGLETKPRPTGAVQEAWLRRRLKKLESANIIIRVYNPRYSCPIHIVPKQSSDPEKQFRLVVDMRLVNQMTVRTSLQLPHFEEQLQSTKKARIYSTLDLMSGFDYLPTHPDSQQYFNMIAPWGAAYTFIGAPQGWKNTPMFFPGQNC